VHWDEALSEHAIYAADVGEVRIHIAADAPFSKKYGEDAHMHESLSAQDIWCRGHHIAPGAQLLSAQTFRRRPKGRTRELSYQQITATH
jgi:hypothetical protein